MTVRRIVTCVLVIALTGAAASAADEALLAAAHKNAAGGLAVVSAQAGPGGRAVSGLAICIAKDAGGMGVFMTLSLNRVTIEAGMKDVGLIVPDSNGKRIRAEVIGMDPITSITFLRTLEKHDWTVIRFASKSSLRPGLAVASVGTMGTEADHKIYLGAANVSAVVRAPEKLVRVTAGSLTNVGSPVFAGNGAAIGIVGRHQPYWTHEMLTQRGAQRMAMKDVEAARYFTPVEEFVGVLKRIAQAKGSPRPAWIGVMQFAPLEGMTAELSSVKGPAVVLKGVAPGGPGAQAGLRDEDIVVGVDGKGLEAFPTNKLTAINLQRQIVKIGVGKTVTLDIVRGDKKMKIPVKLEAMPLMPDEAGRLVSSQLGFLVRNKVWLDQSMGRTAAARAAGVVVIQLQRDGPAVNAGVKAGDVVSAVNSQAITSVAQMRTAMEKVLSDPKKPPLTLEIRRGDQVLNLTVAPRK